MSFSFIVSSSVEHLIIVSFIKQTTAPPTAMSLRLMAAIYSLCPCPAEAFVTEAGQLRRE